MDPSMGSVIFLRIISTHYILFFLSLLHLSEGLSLTRRQHRES